MLMNIASKLMYSIYIRIELAGAELTHAGLSLLLVK